MSLKLFFVRALDRRGGRFILSLIATLAARLYGNSPITIQYRGMWFHKLQHYAFPTGTTFTYKLGAIQTLHAKEAQLNVRSYDYWFRHYAPRPGDTIIDVGAGRGEDAVAFSEAVGSLGKVIAVEAHPRSYAMLQKMCELNGLMNVKLYNLALIERPGHIHLTDEEYWESNSVATSPGPTIEVKADTLDNLCARERIREIAFLKVNIEGAEEKALLGMRITITQCQSVCIACHDFRADRGEHEYFRTRDFVKRYLKENGFKVMTRDDDPRDYVRDHVFGVRDTDGGR